MIWIMGKNEPKYIMGSTSILWFDFINMLSAKSSSSYISGYLKPAVHLLTWLANSLDVWNFLSKQATTDYE